MWPVLLLFSIGVLISALGFVSALFFLWKLRVPAVRRDGSISLVMPLTGASAGLPLLMNLIEEQSLKPRRLIVVVESEADPAFAAVSALARECSFAIEVVVAGLSSECAQKCLNIRAGLERLDERDDAVVLLDADIQPARDWLSNLASPVLAGEYDVVSGYRWQWLAAPGLGPLLMATVDRAIALLPRPPSAVMPWGGSVALSKKALSMADPASWLDKTVSDDCALGLRIHALGLTSLVRRVLLVKSPVDGSLTACWHFGRRQYQMIRIYRPGLWSFAFLLLLAKVAAWIALFSALPAATAAWCLAMMYLFAAAGLLVQSIVARRLDLDDLTRGPGWLLVMALLKPLADLFHLAIIAGSAGWRVVRWGHVTYSVASKFDVRVTGRKSWSAS